MDDELMQGALPGPTQAPAMAQAQGNPSMQQLLQQMTQRYAARPVPTNDEYNQSLNEYISAIRGPQQGQSVVESLGYGLMKGPAENRWAGAMKNLADRRAMEEENAYKRNLLAAKAKYEDTIGASKGGIGAGATTQLLHAALNPMQNIGGFGVNRVTGEVIVPKDYTEKYLTLKKTFYDKLVESGVENADEISSQMAQKAITGALNTPSVSGPAFAQRPEKAPLPAQGGALPEPTEAKPRIEGGAETRAMMKKRMEALAASGDFAGALELQNALKQGVDVTPTIAANIEPVQKAPQPLSKPQMAGAETNAQEIAKEHSKMSQQLVEQSKNYQQMSSMLDQVESDLQSLKPGSPVEPGKLANFKTGMLSWLDAMGVPLTDEGKQAIASSISMGKTNIKLSAKDTKAFDSTPAVFQFKKMLESNPGPDLTPETIQKLTATMRKSINTGMQETQDFTDWHKDNPQAPVADFATYRNLVQTPWWDKFSEKYQAANGRLPSYADIAADAKERGLTFTQLISEMHKAARKGK